MWRPEISQPESVLPQPLPPSRRFNCFHQNRAAQDIHQSPWQCSNEQSQWQPSLWNSTSCILSVKTLFCLQDGKETRFQVSQYIPRQFHPCRILSLQQMLQVGDHWLQLSLRAKLLPCALKGAAILFQDLQRRLTPHSHRSCWQQDIFYNKIQQWILLEAGNSAAAAMAWECAHVQSIPLS